ncbi:MAG: transporter substrate-binding domain-containing protein [Coriobacteriia bacterium]|nr:transporter substrate-binding domain-containing protein [Coriobacteriia bacterium]
MKKRVVAAIVSAMAACLMFALCGCTEAYNPDASMKEQTVDASATKNAGTMIVGVDASSYPFAGQSNGKMSGLEVDVAAALAQEMGLKVDFVDVGMDGLEALADGEVDVVMGVEEDADTKAWKSEAYSPACICLYSMDEGAKVPKKGSDITIAAQTSSLSAWLVTRQYGNEALQAEDELKAVFQGLQDGTVPYVAADAVVGSYVLNSMGIDGHIIGLMQPEGGYCMAVSADNSALQVGLTEALSTIQGNGLMSIIMTKWTGCPVAISDVPMTAGAKAEAKRS